MLDRTSAKKAPWVVVEGNDKKYARVKILKDFIKRSKNILK
jgi:polyphosphate kinase 2 (PPK2 family)